MKISPGFYLLESHFVSHLPIIIGLLAPISQLKLAEGRLSWEPPFTLAGVPILGYVVTVNNTAMMNTTTTNTTLDVEHFILEHCHTYQFTVAALNSVGTGGNNSVVGTYIGELCIGATMQGLLMLPTLHSPLFTGKFFYLLV